MNQAAIDLMLSRKRAMIQPALEQLNLKVNRTISKSINSVNEPPYIHVLPGYKISVYEVDWNPALPPIKIAIGNQYSHTWCRCWVYDHVLGCDISMLKSVLNNLMLSARESINTMFASVDDIIDWLDSNGYAPSMHCRTPEAIIPVFREDLPLPLCNITVSVKIDTDVTKEFLLYENARGAVAPYSASFYDHRDNDYVVIELANEGWMKSLIHQLSISSEPLDHGRKETLLKRLIGVRSKLQLGIGDTTDIETSSGVYRLTKLSIGEES